MTERFTTNAAAHALLIQDNTILMLRRFNTGWMDGLYTTPTGHIENGESAAAAAVRELQEETGVSAELADMEHAITIHRLNAEGTVYFDNYFIAKHWTGEPRVTEPDKSDAVEWLACDELSDNVVPTVLRAIKAYQTGKHYAEEGWL